MRSCSLVGLVEILKFLKFSTNNRKTIEIFLALIFGDWSPNLLSVSPNLKTSLHFCRVVGNIGDQSPNLEKQSANLETSLHTFFSV